VTAGDNPAERQAFVEDFASTLIAAGVPRMPARVFSCLLMSDAGRLTAAEVAQRLQVSPAAVSGAIQYLDRVRLVRRTRDPGARRDVYVVEQDVWYQASFRQDQVLDRWIDHLETGIALLGRQTPVGKRLAESREFFIFLKEEMAQVLDRWEQRKRLQVPAS
jgi:DNA-binding transcriptional regulator GbsR (MarR family)